jgi:hypothetical protein
VDSVTIFFIALIFIIPWAVAMWKLLCVIAYEWRVGLYAGVSLFALDRLWNLQEERRRIDPRYQQLRLALRRWFIITGVAWLAMTGGLMLFTAIAS